MGQAFRRSFGKVQTSTIESSSSKLKNPTTSSNSSSHLRPSPPPPPPPPPAVSVENPEISTKEDNVADLSSSSETTPQVNVDNLLEERDPQYDVLLSQMTGRIKTKAGGKLEMGEASVVEKYNRPMPKLRNTKPNSGSYEERPVASGTMNVKQLRHIILLHQGKADDHDGPMNFQQIAEKFRIDAVQVQSILQSVSLPVQESSKQDNKR